MASDSRDMNRSHLERARKVLPGGVTTAARFDKSLGRPFFISRGEGSRLYDLDGKPYIDMNTSFGAALMGHGHPKIREALNRAGQMGIACATEFPEQVELAEKVCAAVPSAEMVRFTLSGTETTWYIVRLARLFTGRKKIIKIEGHFHGYNDYLQFNYWPKPGEGLPAVRPETPGFPEESADNIIVLPFNDPGALEETIRQRGGEIAAVIMEPVNYNSGCIMPGDGYLRKVRDITAGNGILLVFDEILSGFRTGPDCMQGYYGVTPDICALGKALGGGAPLSAFAGRRDIMSLIAPEGRMMHSGTYNANAVGILCGNAFMDAAAEKDAYPPLLTRSSRLYEGMNAAFAGARMPAEVKGLGCRFGILFGASAGATPLSYADVAGQDWDMAYAFFREAFRRGVFFNGGWHHGISFAHSDDDVSRVIQVCGEAAQAVMSNRK